MLRWIRRVLLGAPEVESPVLRRGDRVRKIDDELVGTLSSWVARDGIEHARVVYCGNRTTWVELVDAGLLRPA